MVQTTVALAQSRACLCPSQLVARSARTAERVRAIGATSDLVHRTCNHHSALSPNEQMIFKKVDYEEPSSSARCRFEWRWHSEVMHTSFWIPGVPTQVVVAGKISDHAATASADN